MFKEQKKHLNIPKRAITRSLKQYDKIWLNNLKVSLKIRFQKIFSSYSCTKVVSLILSEWVMVMLSHFFVSNTD